MDEIKGDTMRTIAILGGIIVGVFVFRVFLISAWLLVALLMIGAVGFLLFKNWREMSR